MTADAEPRDNISRAEAYVAASNAHDLEAITPMFADDADYVSSRTGTYSGIPDIIEMMRGFFEGFGDATWVTDNWRDVEGNGVEFTFVLTISGTGRPGTERVFFNDYGRIRRIEVET